MTKRETAQGKVEVACPKCGRTLSMDVAAAEKRMKVRCACGESVPLVKAF